MLDEQQVDAQWPVAGNIHVPGLKNMAVIVVHIYTSFAVSTFSRAK